MRKALIVGIDYYKHASPLFGCVNDALSVESILQRHGNSKINFQCKPLHGSQETKQVARSELKDNIGELFKGEHEVALFYFAGHGFIESTGGYLITSDSSRGDEGVSLNEILTFANESPSKNKLVILDSCHSGIAGSIPHGGEMALLSKGMTVLTASTDEQYATEVNGRGVFTSLLVDALSGSAANLVGDITPGSVYAHIDQSLGAWEQRPVFKTNIEEFVSLRKVETPIELSDLAMLKTLFPEPGYRFELDPTFEPSMKGRDAGMPLPIEENTKKFETLQKYNRVNLLVPNDAPHMWHAAMESKSCCLTALGEHYRRLADKGRI